MLCLSRKKWAISKMPPPILLSPSEDKAHWYKWKKAVVYVSPLLGDALGRLSKGSHRDDLFLGHCVKTKDKELLCAWGSFHYSTQWYSVDPQHPQHLRTCERCKFLSPTPDPLNQKSGGGAQQLCFNKPSS